MPSQSHCKIPVIVAALVPSILLITLVPNSRAALSASPSSNSLGGLYTSSHQLLEFVLECVPIQLYNLFRHGLFYPFRMVSQSFFLTETRELSLFYLLLNFGKLFRPIAIAGPFRYPFCTISLPTHLAGHSISCATGV